ncbi:hypothetical protein PFMG_00509 [Plasmodium falciparum IGH-CR14]|uniref:Uncharacterized protein n=1 Tax=Plasmodium falciparum IGH-CR14 TaxID=580059 RepID=A0A0L1I3T2_PLAFA|nr:hypothetical protein PFMG_00509 [Plasmodium falciparum IGH-CR14]
MNSSIIEYRKHLEIFYKILTNTDPNDDVERRNADNKEDLTSADPEGQIMREYAADPEYS